MLNKPAVSMRELELESAALLPSRETLMVLRWHHGHGCHSHGGYGFGHHHGYGFGHHGFGGGDGDDGYGNGCN